MPSSEDARRALVALAPLLRKKTAALLPVRIGTGATAVTLLLPSDVLPLLAEVLGTLASGRDVSVLSADRELSTQEAAELMGLSRPTVAKMLDEGELGGRKVGVRRRIRALDVEQWVGQREAIRRYVDELLASAPPLETPRRKRR
ncbi:MAG: helix-turn-helix domain-containing protein [Myxococcales bacterium]|nr:helix-turn-helix domain-containing protein [Myxococcales bacterium]